MITPAPVMIAVITRGVGQGRKAAFLTVLGGSFGDAIQLLFVAMGLSTILFSSTLAFKIMKYAGAAYFIYLGVRMICNKSEFSFQSDHLDNSYTPTAKGSVLSSGVLMWQGFVPSLLNIETTLFFVTLLPQFIDQNRGSIVTQIFLLEIIFALIGLVIYAPIAYFSGSIGSWLRSKGSIANRMQWVMGIVFVALGIRAAFQEESS
jgi:threonine/homoserine/homoserine lactone efflux protein